MDKVRIQSGDWVVVCDGRKALFLENCGDAKFPNLRTKEVHEHEQAATHTMGTDAPGSVHASVGTARSSVEQTDWHDEEERLFLGTIVHRLDAAIAAGHVKNLIVIAAPRALGMLRQGYSPAVRHAVRTELGKDYVRLPLHEIETHLAG
jgi:protein required for attachment to host cells